MQGEAESTRALSIGIIIGGRTPRNRAWIDELNKLTEDVMRVRADIEAPLNLNVVFHVAGNLLQPEFEGVRTGSFRKADMLLMVQVALVESAPSNARAHLLAMMKIAVAEAETWSLRKRLAFDREPLMRILSLLSPA